MRSDLYDISVQKILKNGKYIMWTLYVKILFYKYTYYLYIY